MGAIITQKENTELAIGDKTSVELGGIPTSAYGSIVLTAASSNGAKLSFVGTGATGSKLLLGAGTGGTALTITSKDIFIGSAKIASTGLAGADYLALASGHLVQLGGTTQGSIEANNTSGTSNAPLNVTLASTSVVSLTDSQ
jgi:hypothetical protein